MSASANRRTTAEIVADLREWIVWFAHQDTDSTLPAEAADRLEALDAEVEQYVGLVAEVRHLRREVPVAQIAVGAAPANATEPPTAAGEGNADSSLRPSPASCT